MAGWGTGPAVAAMAGAMHDLFVRLGQRAAGRMGGKKVSANREHMSRIGRVGGKTSARKRKASDAAAPEQDLIDTTDVTTSVEEQHRDEEPQDVEEPQDMESPQGVMQST